MAVEDLCDELAGVAHLVYGLSATNCDRAEKNALLLVASMLDDIRARVAEDYGKDME